MDAVGAPGKGVDQEMAMTVLIGFADSFSAIEAAWSLQRAGFNVLAVNRAGRKPSLRHVRGVRLIDVTPPEQDAARCVADIERLIAHLRPAALLPLDDAALWLTNQLDASSCRIVAPDHDSVAWALDKAAQLRQAAVHGLAVPDTTVIETPADLQKVEFPRMLKPSAAVELVDGRLTRPSGRVCADQAELGPVAGSLHGYPLLAQPVLAGTGEGVFGYVGNTGPVAWSGHRRVRMVNPQGSASSACESIDPDPVLVSRTSAMLTALGWRGLFMAEFLRDSDGVAWFMEVNGRAWGSMALARRRGFEYPAWAIQDALGLPIDPPPPFNPPHVRCRHAGREILHAAFVWRGPQSSAITQWPGRAPTVRDLLTIRRHDRWYNWDSRQPQVLLSDTWQALSSQVRNRKRAHA